MSLEGFIWGVAVAAVAVIVLPYAWSFHRRQRIDRERKAEASRLGVDRPTAQFPYIDAGRCIGCAACVDACPEGDVLGIVGGTATVINGLRCVGHSLCEEACPVGAIEVGLGDLKGRSDIPLLDDHLQTTLPGVFVAGELGGLALVRNAAAQGRQAMEGIVARCRERPSGGSPDILDVAIVGAGPAGLSAALRAHHERLAYAVLEREPSLGGSILHYPRRKMVLTRIVELPPWGKLNREEYSKEELLDVFEGLVGEIGLDLRFSHAVEEVTSSGDHHVLRVRGGREIHAHNVLLTLGRRGEPRKLGVPGEDGSKVMYRLIDAESYRDHKLLVVGGGDSAVEAAIGLARQPGNVVSLSYRRDRLVRIKKKNQDKVDQLLGSGKVRPLFGTNVSEILPDWVRLRGAEGEELEIENDYVFVFAGGVPPFAFLKKIGVRFGGEEATG